MDFLKSYYDFIGKIADFAGSIGEFYSSKTDGLAVVGAIGNALLFAFLYFNNAEEVSLGVLVIIMPLLGAVIGAFVSVIAGGIIVLLFIQLPLFLIAGFLAFGPWIALIYILFSTIVREN